MDDVRVEMVDGPTGPLEVSVPGARHALSPEQPELVSAAVVEWSDGRR